MAIKIHNFTICLSICEQFNLSDFKPTGAGLGDAIICQIYTIFALIDHSPVGRIHSEEWG